MARLYTMPPDTREKEKIIGGVLNIYQLLWIGAGIALALLNALLFFRIFRWFVFIVGVIPIVVGCLFAFKKMGNFTLFQYLYYKKKFNNKIKRYINKGTNTSNYFGREGI